MIYASVIRMNGERRSIGDGRKVILEISEHDASRLLALVRQEIDRAENAWQSYWQQVANNIEQSVEHSAMKPNQVDVSAGQETQKTYDSTSNTNGEC